MKSPSEPVIVNHARLTVGSSAQRDTFLAWFWKFPDILYFQFYIIIQFFSEVPPQFFTYMIGQWRVTVRTGDLRSRGTLYIEVCVGTLVSKSSKISNNHLGLFNVYIALVYEALTVLS